MKKTTILRYAVIAALGVAVGIASTAVAGQDKAKNPAKNTTYTQKKLDTSETVDNPTLAMQVREELKKHKVDVKLETLGTKEGTVTITGTARTQKSADEAEQSIRKMDGVKRVNNKLVVEP